MNSFKIDDHTPFASSVRCVPHQTWTIARRRANVGNVNFTKSLRLKIFIINSVDKSNSSCNTPNDTAPQII